MKYKFVCLILLACCSGANAGNATHCISVGYTQGEYGLEGQTLKNTCDRKIEVVWCHKNNIKKHKSGRCGNKGRFYQKRYALEPGEVKSNYYSLPSKGLINYGACTGGNYSTETNGRSDAKFNCK